MVDLVPLSFVPEAPLGGFSVTSAVEEIEVPTAGESTTSDTEVPTAGGPTTSDTDTDARAVPLAGGSANQSVTAESLHADSMWSPW
jgi:hypothetical protein